VSRAGGDDYRGLGWAHGALTVQRLGAMLAPVTFVLRDGRQVSPFHIAPWVDEPGSDALPGILRKLRGEWPCVPFGYSVSADGWPEEWSQVMGSPEPNEEVHGHSSNNDWTWMESDGRSLSLALDYPETSPVARVERTVTPDPAAPAVDIQFSIVVRRASRLPIGLHPVFRLPAQADAAELELGAFDHGRTYPGDVEPGAPLFARDATFSSLSAVPARAGGTVDASRLPLAEDTEELLQIQGLDGTAALANHAEGYRVKLSWQKEHFPSLLLWYSNRGRKAFPWNGRHVAIGVEPIRSPFGLGPATAIADNPIARSGIPTALEFSLERPFTTRYRIEAAPL
jgi:galactose mutarotase-like enzyme